MKKFKYGLDLRIGFLIKLKHDLEERLDLTLKNKEKRKENMKKLFLTSGIIACMACPAFANPAVSGFDTTQSNANSTSTASGECVSTSIGTTHDSATLVAQWIENFHVMELNENDGNQSAAQGGATGATYDTSEPSNDNLWLTPYDSSTNEGGGVYTRANNPNGAVITTSLATAFVKV